MPPLRGRIIARTTRADGAQHSRFDERSQFPRQCQESVDGGQCDEHSSCTDPFRYGSQQLNARGVWQNTRHNRLNVSTCGRFDESNQFPRPCQESADGGQCDEHSSFTDPFRFGSQQLNARVCVRARLFVCVCACMRAPVCVCARACLCVCVCMRASACVCVRARAKLSTRNSKAET